MRGNEAKLDHAIARILALEWPFFMMGRGNSHRALLYEYFRRATLWDQALYGNYGLLSNIWNIPKTIAPTLELDEDRLEDLRRALKHAIPSFPIVRRSCEFYVAWAAIEDMPKVLAYNLPAPYEPLIRIFERGGLFDRDNVYIRFQGGPDVNLPITKAQLIEFLDRPPLLEMDDDTLDRLDDEAAP